MPTRLHRAARHLTHHLGVHGSGLLLIAAIWLLVGLRLLVDPIPPPPSTWHGMIPDPVRMTLWWSAALLCIGAAVDRSGPRRDGFALTVAVVPPMIALTSYLWAWLVSLFPGEPHGYPGGWYAAALYAALVGLVWLVAAIPDESEPR
jgi:hypothetical protein